MYNTAYCAFSDALKREGRVITAYSDNTPYNVIFRINKDTNQLTDKLTIFYSADSGIHAGQLLTYGNKHFLVLNQETPESDVYYKSSLLETNAVIHAIINSNEIDMPVYAYDIADGLTEKSNVMSLISGNIHIMAEPNAVIKSLALDNEFDTVGRHWKIDNIISKDNVIHLYCEIAQTISHTYSVTITANDTYHHGESAQLTAVAKQDDTIVNNIPFVWTSSNASLATVDNTGLVNFIADGSVTITATWEFQNVSGTKTITITEPDTYSLSITANDSYTTADTPTLTATAQKNGTADTTATITWISSDASIATIDSTGKATFLKAGNVTFTATWTQQNKTATITVTVTQAAGAGTCVVTHNNGNVYATTDVCNLREGGTPMPFNAVFKDASGNAITGLTPEWSFIDLNGITMDDITLVPSVSGYPLRCTVQIANKASLIGATLKLHLIDSGHTLSSYDVNIKIVSFT
jgi:uncharacterized protein YjdB